ncbi:MAG: aminodeoxychorismate/anthranilate synthase component II [Bacteroidota bacterium]
MKVLLIDNYDSFTYNIAHAIKELGAKVDVRKNDQCPLSVINDHDKIILSPGPGIPDEAGDLKALIEASAGQKPVLGVCLGLQALVEVFGGKIKNLNKVYHGVATQVKQTQSDYLFENIDVQFEAGRYHSWVADPEGMPDDLEVIAEDSEGAIMAIRHKAFEMRAVQYHPESILTPSGNTLFKNFLNR